MEEKRIWGIHTMDDHLFLNNNVIAIGWKAIGDLSLIEADREAFKEKYKQRIGECYIIHPRNFMIKDDIICIPPYMTICL